MFTTLLPRHKFPVPAPLTQRLAGKGHFIRAVGPEDHVARVFPASTP